VKSNRIWVIKYPDKNGKMLSTTFNINVLGFEKAKEKAII